MKKLIETTTGTISNQMILDHCGYSAGEFQNESYELLSKVCELPEFENNHWTDIMFDEDGIVYAIWAEDSLTCYNALCYYVELEKKYCPKAFNEMKKKLA
jgi:hypothetical protein